MLFETDKAQLGDRHLSPEEAVAREREELLRMASTRRIWGQAELEDAERSAGPRLAYGEIIARLRKANSEIKVVDGAPGSVAIYRPKRSYEYDEEERDSVTNWHWDFKYVTGMETKELPEYSHVILDTSNLPVREYRGWRSVVIAAIKNGAISYDEAVRHFGEPFGPRADRWFEQLARWKQYSDRRLTAAELENWKKD